MAVLPSRGAFRSLCPLAGDALANRLCDGARLFLGVFCALRSGWSCHARRLTIERAIWASPCISLRGIFSVLPADTPVHHAWSWRYFFVAAHCVHIRGLRPSAPSGARVSPSDDTGYLITARGGVCRWSEPNLPKTAPCLQQLSSAGDHRRAGTRHLKFAFEAATNGDALASFDTGILNRNFPTVAAPPECPRWNPRTHRPPRRTAIP